MKKQAGFTLIELIMVIVILGILSAFALPRFANLTDSAQEAAVEGARASVASSSAIIHAAALVAGVSSDAVETVDIEGGTADLVFGYPAVTSVSGFNIADVAQIGDFTSVEDTTSLTVGGAATSVPVLVVYQGDSFTDGEKCFVYTQATDAETPSAITAVGDIGDTDSDGVLDAGETCSGVTVN